MRQHKGVENGRLSRGAQLAIRHLGPGEYAVQGSRGVRHVNLNLDVPCDCEDAQHRPQFICKHVLAARLQERDWSVIHHLVEQIAARERRKAEAQ